MSKSKEELYIGAYGYSANAAEAVRLFQRLVGSDL
jgi:hypothetical protein